MHGIICFLHALITYCGMVGKFKFHHRAYQGIFILKILVNGLFAYAQLIGQVIHGDMFDPSLEHQFSGFVEYSILHGLI